MCVLAQHHNTLREFSEWAACNPVSSEFGSIFIEEGHAGSLCCQASHLIYPSRNEAFSSSSDIPQIQRKL